MFNWVTSPWAICSISLLIICAFFWPNNKSAELNEFEHINKNQPLKQSSDTNKIERTNSFTRVDDNARVQRFKEQDKLDQEIQALLDEANALVENLSYTLPAERNAMLVYKEVLALSPNNSSARQGIENISQKLFEIGIRALGNNQLSSANRTLQKLININESSEQSIQLVSAISSWHENKKITDLVDAGDTAFEKQDYIAPATKNALYFYEQALSQSSNNQAAQRGIAKVVNIYHQRIRNEIATQQYAQATTNLEILIEINQNDPLIEKFQSLIDSAIASSDQEVQEGASTEDQSNL